MVLTTLASSADMKLPLPTATSTHHLRPPPPGAAGWGADGVIGPAGVRSRAMSAPRGEDRGVLPCPSVAAVGAARVCAARARRRARRLPQRGAPRRGGAWLAAA